MIRASWPAGVALGLSLLCLAAAPIAACAGALQMSANDTVLVGTEEEQQRACVDKYAPDASAQNACRAIVRATWDDYWARHCDDAGRCDQ